MKFTIRDLLLVTVIVAVALAWWLERSRLIAKVRLLEYEKAMATAHADLARAQEAAARAQAAWKESEAVLRAADAEDLVRGYKQLLDPPPEVPQP